MKKRTQRTETLLAFYGTSITPELCNCKQIYALIVSNLYRFCELWRVQRLRRIPLLNQDIVQAERERIRNHAVIFPLGNSTVERKLGCIYLRRVLAHERYMR